MASTCVDGLKKLLSQVGEIRPLPLFPSAHVQDDPMDIFVSYLAEYLVEKTSCDKQVAYDSIQWPNEFGDLVVVLPRLRLDDVDPTELAARLAADPPRSPLFAHPFHDGFNLRFMFSEHALARILLPYILDRGPTYGKTTAIGLQSQPMLVKPRKVLVEFSSPNMGKAFDGSHLRSTVAGNFIAALHEGMGWEVYRINYMGDWGKHIGLLAVGWLRYGLEDDFAADPLRHLLEVFTRINRSLKDEQERVEAVRAAQATPEENGDAGIAAEKDEFCKRLEDGDLEALALWKRFRKAYIEEYRRLYLRMNVNFDEYSGESVVSREVVHEAEGILKERDICEESEQAWILDFAKHGHPGLGTAIVRYRNGTTSYLLRDIATAIDRYREHAFEKMIYVVTTRQSSHFRQLFTALDLMGKKELAEKLEHVSFGKDKGLSPKEGSSGLLLGDILDQSHAAVQMVLDSGSVQAHDLSYLEQTARATDELGSLALMAQDLSGKRSSTFIFDPAKFATTEGHTMLYLKASLNKLQRTLIGQVVDRSALDDIENDSGLLGNEAFLDILRHLILFPGVVRTSYRSLESSGLMIYLYRLADLLSLVMDNESETDGEHRRDTVTMFLCTTHHVLSNGLALLGLKAGLPAG